MIHSNKEATIECSNQINLLIKADIYPKEFTLVQKIFSKEIYT